MKIGFKETDSKEYRCIAMAMYSFIIFMLFFALCRLCGWFWFSVEYKPIEISKITYVLLNLFLKGFEGGVILTILTSMNVKKSFLVGFIISMPIAFVTNSALAFILDIIFMISLPFIFNKDKDKSVLKSFYLIILLSLYQLLMSFARYNMSLEGKWDLGYSLLSIIDYRCFLITIMLYSIKRRFYKK